MLEEIKPVRLGWAAATGPVLVTRRQAEPRSSDRDRLSVLIVDSHWVTSRGVKQLLAEEFRGIAFGEARTRSEALKEIEKRAWHAVILEINIPGNHGLQILEDVLARRPETRVVVLTVDAESQCASQALSLGALAYLTKDCPRVDLIKAFRRVLMGARPLARSEKSAPPVIRVSAHSHETLSSQEFKVMLALGAGNRPGEIAAALNLSIKTVSTYKKRILSKMQLRSSADLIRYMVNHQLS